MATPHSSPMVRSGATDDEDLARVTEASLSIGPQIIFKCDLLAFVLPEKAPHAGLYSTSLRDSPMTTAVAAEPSPPNKGILGFPDFPDCWNGEEGGARLGSRNISSCSRSSIKRAHRKGRRLARPAVNAPAVHRGRELKRTAQKHRRTRRSQKVQQMLQKRQRKREMGDLRVALASLKCS